MTKQTFDIPASQDGKWGSYISKYPADSGKLPFNAFSIGTRNLVTSLTGMMDKRSGGVIWNPNSLLSGAPLDQYEGIFASGVRLLIVNDAGTLKASTGNGLFQTITAGFTNPANFEFATYQNRVYGDNGVNAPIVMDTATSYGGVTYAFTTAKTRPMGAQPPVSAPTAVRNTDSTTLQVPAGSHTYKITFVYYNGVEESNGGPVSAVCVNDATHTSNALTSIPIGGYGVTARNIYRDNNDGNWLLLDFINDNTTTTYTDRLIIGGTPTPIPTTNSLPPVFRYLALYLDRLFVIDITGKTIAWSNAGQPDIFNPVNTISGPPDDVMTAIYVYNGIPWVFGQHTVGTILGNTDGTFFYNPVSTTVGCVDNRSIQTRSIISVPTMIWLSALPNKGLYFTNGSAVQYLSDAIEDLTFNLAQIAFLQRSNTQNSQSAFQGGTASPSIDLLSNPGTIQTIDPVARYSHAADWQTGVLSNLSPVGDQLQVPTGFAPAAGSGSFVGDGIFSGNNLQLPASPLTNEDTGPLANTTDLSIGDAVAQPFDPARNGSRILNNITISLNQPGGGGPATFTVSVYTDNLGQPGTALYTSGTNVVSSTSFTTFSYNPNLSVVQGNRYWMVLHFTPNTSNLGFHRASGTLGFAGLGQLGFKEGNAGLWFGGYINATICFSYTVAGIADTSTWTSGVYDTGSVTLTNNAQKFITVGSYPGGTSISVQVQGSNNQSSWTTTDTLSNPTGTVALAGGTYRYWRFVIAMTTTDSRTVPVMSIPFLMFDMTGVWTSAAILMTTDITALDALIQTTNVPAGTTSITTMATSASSGSGYTAFTAIGSAVPNTYAKIRVTMTTDSNDVTSPTLLTAELDWLVTGSLISSAIDTAASPPSGWGIFQYSQVGSTGTVAFYFRSATSSGGLSSATFVLVPNGTIPASSPLEWAQWKAVMSASVDNIPEVDSVTVNWLLTNGRNVRAASLFFNKSYYLAVATIGSNTNNLLIELDYEGNWRIHSGNNIGTLGTFFNDAFNGDSTNGNIYNMFKLPTDNGTNIVMDGRTKAFDQGDNLHLKTVRSCRVTGVNTGTTIHTYYSVDRGTTWVEMVNSSGTLGYTTTNDGMEFVEYFIPLFDGVASTSGRTVIFRVVSSDAFACSILRVSPTLYMRKGKAITEAMA